MEKQEISKARQMRIDAFADTVETVENNGYVNTQGKFVEIDDIGDSTFVSRPLKPKFPDERHDTELKVVNMDSLLAAKALIDRGMKPAVLNMASWRRPGGYVEGGSSAQEENLFRRTNLYEGLFPFHKEMADKYNFIPNKDNSYPLSLNHGGIYTPHVTVFRGTDEEEYPYLDETFFIDVLTVAAIKNPKLLEGNKLSEEDKDVTRNKIRTMLNLALMGGNDSLVLGAFGCGAYHTPPEEIATLFKEVLSEEGYRDSFKAVHFAILNSNANFQSHNPRGNFAPFKEIIEN